MDRPGRIRQLSGPRANHPLRMDSESAYAGSSQQINKGSRGYKRYEKAEYIVQGWQECGRLLSIGKGESATSASKVFN